MTTNPQNHQLVRAHSSMTVAQLKLVIQQQYHLPNALFQLSSAIQGYLAPDQTLGALGVAEGSTLLVIPPEHAHDHNDDDDDGDGGGDTARSGAGDENETSSGEEDDDGDENADNADTSDSARRRRRRRDRRDRDPLRHAHGAVIDITTTEFDETGRPLIPINLLQAVVFDFDAADPNEAFDVRIVLTDAYIEYNQRRYQQARGKKQRGTSAQASAREAPSELASPVSVVSAQPSDSSTLPSPTSAADASSRTEAEPSNESDEPIASSSSPSPEPSEYATAEQDPQQPEQLAASSSSEEASRGATPDASGLTAVADVVPPIPPAQHLPRKPARVFLDGFKLLEHTQVDLPDQAIKADLSGLKPTMNDVVEEHMLEFSSLMFLDVTSHPLPLHKLDSLRGLEYLSFSCCGVRDLSFLPLPEQLSLLDQPTSPFAPYPASSASSAPAHAPSYALAPAAAPAPPSDTTDAVFLTQPISTAATAASSNMHSPSSSSPPSFSPTSSSSTTLASPTSSTSTHLLAAPSASTPDLSEGATEDDLSHQLHSHSMSSSTTSTRTLLGDVPSLSSSTSASLASPSASSSSSLAASFMSLAATLGSSASDIDSTAAASTTMHAFDPIVMLPVREYFVRLKSLDLSYNAIDAESIARLTTLRSLQSLSLAGNQLTALPPMHFRHLTKLSLARNALGGWTGNDTDRRDAAMQLRLMKRGIGRWSGTDVRIEIGSVPDVDDGYDGGQQQQQQPASAAAAASYQHPHELRRCARDRDYAVWYALQFLDRIEELDLSDNSLQYVPVGLRGFTHLVLLNLAGNALPDAEQLVGVSTFPRLRRLDAKGNLFNLFHKATDDHKAAFPQIQRELCNARGMLVAVAEPVQRAAARALQDDRHVMKPAQRGVSKKRASVLAPQQHQPYAAGHVQIGKESWQEEKRQDASAAAASSYSRGLYWHAYSSPMPMPLPPPPPRQLAALELPFDEVVEHARSMQPPRKPNVAKNLKTLETSIAANSVTMAAAHESIQRYAVSAVSQSRTRPARVVERKVPKAVVPRKPRGEQLFDEVEEVIRQINRALPGVAARQAQMEAMGDDRA